MEYICIKDCDNREVNTYCNDKVFTYTFGERYVFNMNLNYLKNIIYHKGTYKGYVTNEFIHKYFTPKYLYDILLDDINKLFSNTLELFNK